MDIQRATLKEIADELRRRAKRTCSGCGGYGSHPSTGSTSMMDLTCTRCNGCGYEPRSELDELGQRLERIAL